MTFFFFNDTATTEIYTLSLHDALPISQSAATTSPESEASFTWRPSATIATQSPNADRPRAPIRSRKSRSRAVIRSEEHTSELQSRQYLVCRLLLEKKKKKKNHNTLYTP